jgi:sigma-B regulation protein RsbU (phosphoserine phosphatase)
MSCRSSRARTPRPGNYLTHLVRSEGMPVGLVPDEIFANAIEDKIEHFDPGDTLVLFTDGVTEAPNEEEKEFSSARLADVVRALHTRPRARSTTGSWRASAASRATRSSAMT